MKVSKEKWAEAAELLKSKSQKEVADILGVTAARVSQKFGVPRHIKKDAEAKAEVKSFETETE